MSKVNLEKSKVTQKSFADGAVSQAKREGITDPKTWCEDFMWGAFNQKGADGQSIVSTPLSPTSIILHYAAKADMRVHASISEDLASVIARVADSDHDTDLLARHLIMNATSGSTAPLPKALEAYAHEILSGKRLQKVPRGRPTWQVVVRDTIALQALIILALGFNKHATRNEATVEHSSACDLVSDTTVGLGWLHLTYEAALKLWKERHVRWHKLHLSMTSKAIFETHIHQDSKPFLRLFSDFEKLG